MLGELVADFAVDGTSIYDLGCSTANTFLSAGANLRPDLNVRFVGLDSSEDMLRKAEQKLVSTSFPWPYTLKLHDLNDGLQDRERVGRAHGPHTSVRPPLEP